MIIMFLLVLGLYIANCLSEGSIGNSNAAYIPLSHSYDPYHALLTPYGLNTAPHPQTTIAYSSLVPAENTISALGLKSQYHVGDIYGQTSYGHSEPLQSHHATQDVHGNKAGSFTYVKPDGQVHRTDYVADAGGYRVASNDLPVGPASAPATPIIVPSHVETSVLIESSGIPRETPQVIATKVAHLTAHANSYVHALNKRSIYPLATTVVTPNGYLVDTPEVTAAKAAHFAEHAKRGNHFAATYAAPSFYSSTAQYSLYSHTPVITPDGYLADTPEVAAAKAAHFAEKAKVSSHYNAIPLSHGLVDSYLNNAALTPSAGITYPSYASQSYLANPVILPNGYLADTSEVAHAKTAHLAEHAIIASRQKRSLILGQTPANTIPLVSSIVYAKPFVFSHPYPPTSVKSTYPHALLSKPFAASPSRTAVIHGLHAASFTHRT